EGVAREADRGRVHDLVGLPLAEHAVLVDARLVGECVATHHRLVVLDRVAGLIRDHLRGGEQLGGVDADIDAERLGSGPDRHDHFLHRGVPGTLADAVDGAFHLPGPVSYAGPGVGYRQPQVVVAVGRDEHVLAVTLHLGDDAADHLAVVPGGGEPDGVGDVDRGRTGVHRGLAHGDHELDVGTGGVLGGVLDVVGVLTGAGHARLHRGEHLLLAHLQLVLHVDGRGGQEGVDPRAGGVLDGLPGGVDVHRVGPGQSRHHGPVDLAGDALYRLEVAGGRDREPGLDDVDTQPGELVGDRHLLVGRQGDARRLLAVSQRGVEDSYSVCGSHSRFSPSVSVLAVRSAFERWCRPRLGDGAG